MVFEPDPGTVVHLAEHYDCRGVVVYEELKLFLYVCL